jgi:multidrug transporter EmrE-like cation transporter
MMRYILLFGTVASLALGQLLFKVATKAAPPENPWGFLFAPAFVAALVVYAWSTLAWMFVLRQWPLTVAYPAVALAIVLVLAAGSILFGEQMTILQLAGAGTIIVGLIMLALG